MREGRARENPSGNWFHSFELREEFRWGFEFLYDFRFTTEVWPRFAVEEQSHKALVTAGLWKSSQDTDLCTRPKSQQLNNELDLI